MSKMDINEVFSYWCERLAPQYSVELESLMSIPELATIVESMAEPSGKILKLRDYPMAGGFFLAAVATLSESIFDDERLRHVTQLLFELDTGLPFKGVHLATYDGELVWCIEEAEWLS